MRPSFFIFSLPRSGSSWLSVFLSGADSFCYHEPTADATPEQWVSEATARPERQVGAVDTGAYLFAPKIQQALPKARFFVLERDPGEIGESLRRADMLGINVLSEYSRLSKLPYERIEYARLGDIGYLSDVQSRVLGTSLDPVRTRQLLEMRVQRDTALFMRNRPHIDEHARRLLA